MEDGRNLKQYINKAPKAVRSILYIHWKLRYYPSNNPMNYLATNVTKKLDHNKHPRYMFIPFLFERIPFACTKCIYDSSSF